ncbi:MAG: hypothetical protein PHQ05_00660 [Sterolibacterium sp.]|nr:hypothetical protein [Sterolibacterium sp.]
MKSEEDRKEDDRQENQEDAPESGNRLLLNLKQLRRAIGGQLLRLKHIFQAGVVRMIDASSGLLLRLKKRAEESRDEDTRADKKHPERETRPEKIPAREERVKGAAPREVAVQEPRSPLRSVFIYLLVLVIGAIAGMTFSFALLSTMLFNQAHRIEDQRDEIAQLEKQHSRILESEAKYRKENVEYQKRLSEIEENVAAQNAAKESSLPEPAGSPGIPVTGKQHQAKKTGDCKLDAGNLGGNLTRCVDEFNRK